MSRSHAFNSNGDCVYCGLRVIEADSPCQSVREGRIDISKKSPSADDLQRREYAKAAPPPPKWFLDTNGYGLSQYAAWAYEWADAMLAEQKKREGAQ